MLWPYLLLLTVAQCMLVTPRCAGPPTVSQEDWSQLVAQFNSAYDDPDPYCSGGGKTCFKTFLWWPIVPIAFHVVFCPLLMYTSDKLHAHGKNVRDNAYRMFNNHIAFWNLKHQGQTEFRSDFAITKEDCDEVRVCLC